MVRTLRRGRVIVVASGKGGVGKTSLALNLSIMLARHGVRTILADADFGLANADILLGISPRRNITEVLNERASVEDLLVDGPDGLRVLCGISGFFQQGELCEFSAAQCLRAVERLTSICDALLVDCGSGVTDSVATFALTCDRLVLVTTPEPTAMADAYGLLKILHNRGFRGPVGLVVNMAFSRKDGADAARRLQHVSEQFLGRSLDLLGSVPHDRHVVSAVRERTPLTVRYPSCPASISIDEISTRLAPFRGPQQASPDVWTRMTNLFF